MNCQASERLANFLDAFVFFGINSRTQFELSLRGGIAISSSRTTRGLDAYSSILEFIREDIYQPGDLLREEDVAGRLGMSRTPVREALARLQENGVVETGHGRSLRVATLSTQQIFELYAMRGELEGIVARFAARQATDAEIDDLRRINDLFRSAADASAAYQHNRQFHAQLYDASRNRFLKNAVEQLHESIAVLPRTTFVVEGRIEIGANEHDQIIDALAKRNAELACQLAIAHISSSLKARLQVIGQRQASP